ncbi:MAG: prepilin-type N-terminal cleavage/methylation domain-containing protein [Blastocatellia bacterium]|nr:prepilin-type N-terminal cleavage/methylation domain-containing protein [Blastocatellia bacterium]
MMAHSKKAINAKPPLKRKDSGFSLLEILVVVAIFLILASVAVTSLVANRRNVKTVAAANTLYSLMQQAKFRAISTRVRHLVRIQRSPDANGQRNIVSILSRDPNQTLNNYGPVIRREFLPQDVNIVRPGSTPAVVQSGAPMRDADFINDVFNIVYNEDGSVTSLAQNPGPVSGAIYFSAPDINDQRSSGLMRALSFYSSTGEVKFWFFNQATNQFQSGTMNF